MEKFLVVEHLTSLSTEKASKINFKLCIYISNRQLHKTVPVFLLIMSYSFVYCNNSTNFESVCSVETVTGTVLFVTWLATCQRKKNYLKLQFCPCRSSEYRKSS